MSGELFSQTAFEASFVYDEMHGSFFGSGNLNAEQIGKNSRQRRREWADAEYEAALAEHPEWEEGMKGLRQKVACFFEIRERLGLMKLVKREISTDIDIGKIYGIPLIREHDDWRRRGLENLHDLLDRRF